MRKALAALGAAAAALGLATAGASAQYNEADNLIQAWGQTQKDFGDSEETGTTVLNSANNVFVNLQDPDAPQQGPYQLHAWPWSGDPDREDWGGRKTVVSFDCAEGTTLAGTVWAPSTDELKVDGRAPGVVINEGFQGVQSMYYWAAQGLADAGYVVLTFDVPGQGHSQSGSCSAGALKTAVDYFRSGGNPYDAELDDDRVGTAGHSAGAGAVQSLGDYNGIVKAIVAWSDLRGTYSGNAPIQGQGADYDNWILPPTPTSADGPDSPGKLAGFNGVRQNNTGVDVQEIVIESGTHLAWSHVTWSYTSVWSEEVALHYTLGWFDKYLAGDYSRGGKTATERLKENYAAHKYEKAYGRKAYDVNEDFAGGEPEVHGLSKKYASAYSIGGDVCLNQRLGC